MSRQELERQKQKIIKAIARYYPEVQINLADASIGSHLEVKYRGKIQKFPLNDSNTELSR